MHPFSIEYPITYDGTFGRHNDLKILIFLVGLFYVTSLARYFLALDYVYGSMLSSVVMIDS